MPELAYTYDGTLEGLLTAVHAAYANKEDPCDIMPARNMQARLGQRVVDIASDAEVALRVQRGICRAIGPAAFDAIKYSSLSDDPDAGTIIYRFIRYGMQKNKPHDCSGCSRKRTCGGLCTRYRKDSALNDTMHPAVEPLYALNRAVGNERHLIMQFLRFQRMENDVWFAQCNPKASVVPLVMDWFSQRFNTQAFIIYDEVHGLAGVYNGSDWHLVKTEEIALPRLSEEEGAMQEAWKRFYGTIAVESRFNPELRRQFMPKRFWKNIVEMQESIEAREGSPASDQAPSTPVPSKAGMKLSAAAPSSCQK